MIILFEDHPYKSKYTKEALKGICDLESVDRNVSVSYVGYYYNAAKKDCVFILPKVLLGEEEYLDEKGKKKKRDYIANVYLDKDGNESRKIYPEDIVYPADQKKNLSNEEYRKFIYEFAVWIYRSLCVYRTLNPSNTAIYYKQLPQSGRGARHQANTFLDVILSLIRFNQENQNYFLFTIRNLHSGMNKINWNRTIAHSQAYMQDGQPVYLNPINKKSQINYEEELFVIFFSILNHINESYGFKTPINFQYDLITGKRFTQYKEGYGRTRLLQIKYKYFADKALQLWDLCYAFFDQSHILSVNTDQREYMLAKNYEIVFEAMIDELIGNKDLPKGLKEQEDGKRVDHMYTDLALTSADTQSEREVYYIGDSKYYKSGNRLGSESIYKQYTYARNVIQWNVNLFASDDTAFDDKDLRDRQSDKVGRYGGIKLQDSQLTEGYDVIPNFFISAFVDKNREYIREKNIEAHRIGSGKTCTRVSYQFPDRLFDRDTLFLSHYDVNFLYVLYLYARNRSSEKTQWKASVRNLFREEIRSVIQSKFEIYAMRAKLGVDGELYLKEHFYELHGRVFQPYEEKIYYAFARSTSNMEASQHLYDELSNYFIIEKCAMGKNPKEVLSAKIQEHLQQPLEKSQWLPHHYLQREAERGVLFGYYHPENLPWILGNNDKNTLIYNVRLQTKDDLVMREGSHSAYFYLQQKVKFVVLYTDGVETTGEYRVFHVKDTATKVSEERMRSTFYPKHPNGNYFFYRFDEEVSIGVLPINQILSRLKERELLENGKVVEGEPLFCKAGELLELIRCIDKENEN